MAIKTSCPHCDTAYTLADTQLGKKVRCKSCTETFTVRNQAGAIQNTSPAAGGKPPRPRDDDDRPLPRPKKKGGVPTTLLIGGGIAALLLLVCLGVAGVGLVWYLAKPKVTEENYAKLRMGMSEAEVKSILGEPTLVQGGGGQTFGGRNLSARVLVWKDGPNQISVGLLNDKVVNLGGQFRKSGGGIQNRN